MIPPSTTWYRDALGAPHESYSRVEVWRSDIQLDELTQVSGATSTAQARPCFFGGSVRATLTSRVSRTLSLSVPDFLFPWDTTDLLSPYGTQLRVYRGVRYGSGGEDEFPVFRGPITSVEPTGAGTLTVSCADLAYEVVRNGFTAPNRAQVGDLVVSEFKRIVLDAYPSAVFSISADTFWERVPELTYEEDRGGTLDNLAKTASSYWYALADGTFTFRRVPWTVPVTAGAIAMQDGPGGTIFTAYPSRSSENINNRVTVVCERGDGSAPLYFTASDNDPSSPTYVGGPFGVKATTVQVSGAVTAEQVAEAARTDVRRSRSRTSPWRVTCVPDGSLELGDPLALSVRHRNERGEDRTRAAAQILAGFTLPVGAGGTMSLDCRDLVSEEIG